MRIWREIVAGVRTLLRRGETDRDLSDELRHFLDEAEADLVARGRTPEEARRAVRLRYGDRLTAHENVRGYGWEAGVETLIHDVRLSARNLQRSPSFTAVVVLTLGLGIGAMTAIVSAVRPVLFEPLAYPAAERIVSIADRAEDGSPLRAAFGTYHELVERSRAFASLAAFKPWQPTLTGGDEPARLEGQSVSASYFDVLGIVPVLGPGFDPAEDRPGGAFQVVVSNTFWRERLGADPGAVGRVLELDGEPATVVGVMPARFENATAQPGRLWTLLRYDPSLPGFDTREWGRHLELMGRLRPGVGVDEVEGRLDRIASQPIAEMARPAWASLQGGFAVRPLKDAVVADVKPTMLVLLGAVVLLIVVTCANLTILLLARSSRRRGEFAMRRALGAGRRRLARYLVTEGLLLAGLGGCLGVAVAHAGLWALTAVAPPSLPRIDTVALDGPALGLAIVATALVGFVFGLAPGLHGSRGRWQAIHDIGRGTVRRSRTTRKLLVVSQVAVATILLVGAGLLLRSAERLFSQPPGFDPADVVVMQVHATGLRGDEARHGFFDDALDAVRTVPGVRSAATTSQLPLSGDVDGYGVVPDDPNAVEGTLGPAHRYAVAPGYFATMGVPLLRGRAFDERDVQGAPRVAVVSRSLADRLFPGGNVLGKGVRIGGTQLEPYTVVGIVEDVRHTSLADQEVQALYVPPHQWHWADAVRWIVARTESDQAHLVSAIREAIWSADEDQPVVGAQSMDALVLRSEARRRFVMIILSAFALSAVAVSGVGLFGVLSGTVAERTREMGVRAALGASRERIVTMIVGQGLGLAGVGVALGLIGAVAASEALSAMLFQISRLDPVTYVAVTVLLAVGAVMASAVPAARAGRADPAEALKAE